VRLVGELGQLVDLVGGEELGLVDDQVVDPLPVGPAVADQQPQIGARVYLDRRPAQTDAGADLRRRRSVALGEQQAAAALPVLVVVDLQRQCGLAAVHRAVEEGQVGRRGMAAAIPGRGHRRGHRQRRPLRLDRRHRRSGGVLPASTTARRIGSIARATNPATKKITRLTIASR
jgi:hypothetical protein